MLPPLDIPPRALFIHEEVGERRGNSRFYVRDDGGFFHQRNRSWDAPKGARPGDDSFWWDEAFASEPTLTLDAGQLAELSQALDDAAVSSLSAASTPARARRVSNPVTERFTIVAPGRTMSVVVEDRSVPPSLARLRARLDELLDRAGPPER